MPIEPNLVGHDQCTGTVPGIISYNCFAQTQSYENDLGHMVPNRKQNKNKNRKWGICQFRPKSYMECGDVKFFPMKEGNLTLASKSNA